MKPKGTDTGGGSGANTQPRPSSGESQGLETRSVLPVRDLTSLADRAYALEDDSTKKDALKSNGASQETELRRAIREVNLNQRALTPQLIPYDHTSRRLLRTNLQRRSGTQ